MKKKTVLALTLIISIFPAFAQENSYQLIPYRKGKLWGYCDSKKKILIQPVWEEARWFFRFEATDGLPEQRIGIVKKKGKYGLIDRHGKVLAPCQYDIAEADARTFYLVRDKKSYLYHVDNKKTEQISGDPVHSPQIEELIGYPVKYNVQEISKGRFRIIKEKPVFTNGKYIYNKTDSLDYEADAIYQFADHNGTDSAFYIVKNGKKGLITLGGTQLLEPVFDSLVRKHTVTELGTEAVFCLRNRQWEIAYPFAKGDALNTPPRPVEGEIHFGSAWSTVLLKNKQGWGLLSANGDILIPTVYDSLVDLKYQEVFGLKKNGVWTIKRLDNNTVNNHKFLDVRAEKGQYISAKRLDGTWILMLEIDKEIFPHKKLYGSYSPYFKDFLSVYEDPNGERLLGFAHSNGTRYWD
ncbi:WG repeat-containing protein [Pseudobacter ginsenosidimutans]|uniref:WG repeat protein n=1 Tax=Pseudobacter ginsenosidimutans TaxID=661488 RepID=A0A4Q7N1N5_9BACT|nr:WG repeat-containing protein [Pseudobacter ginsenosidimutans]QEC43706.1 WG repeat-containing protein [Pseudobacter ginsenosidimutans]RZS75112.1 WG repeat protein [Pseudobacter ginsenosidimutans]